MSELTVNVCQCPVCCSPGDHPDKLLHHQMNLFLSRLNEQQRRWYVALESKKIGHGGDKFMSQVTGMNVATIRRGRQELDDLLENRPINRVRLKKNPLVRENVASH